MPKGLAAEKLIVERSSFGATFQCAFVSGVGFQQGFAMKVPFFGGGVKDHLMLGAENDGSSTLSLIHLFFCFLFL